LPEPLLRLDALKLARSDTLGGHAVQPVSTSHPALFGLQSRVMVKKSPSLTDCPTCS